MTQKFEDYQALDYPLPSKNFHWNMYGPGIENIGVNGNPEVSSIPEPDDDQLLVRVDAVGMCFSDVKLIKQGGSHPKLYNRNLKETPTRLGHEAAMTVIKVGADRTEQFYPGQRLIIQPDIYQNKLSTAYGYTIPGGLIQYHLVGDEILDADDGSYVIPVEGDISYAEAALTEPWACVVAAYTQRRRLVPKKGGIMWILGTQNDQRAYEFSRYLDEPKTIVLTDVPLELKKDIRKAIDSETTILEFNKLSIQEFQELNERLCDGDGFDDIVVLAPNTIEVVNEAVKLIAFRGTFNIVADQPFDGPAKIDAGRIHYHYTAFLGNSSPDIAASYGESHNRCELLPEGTLVVIGAGGPMGQMHVQRAIEMDNGPKRIIASDVDQDRLSELEIFTKAIAEKRGKEVFFFNPALEEESIIDFLKAVNAEQLADDVVICVPSGPLMAASASLLAKNGMFVFFAGVAIGTIIDIDVSNIFMNNMQLTGTSGSTLEDQRMVVEKTLANQLSPILSVAAIGGIDAALDGMEAMMTGKYAGKVVIFPQIENLPLIGLNTLEEKYPDIAQKLGDNHAWTYEAEKALITKFWDKETE